AVMQVQRFSAGLVAAGGCSAARTLENGERVRVAGSARNQRPQTVQSSSIDILSKSLPMRLITEARSNCVGANWSRSVNTCPEIASASSKNQAGHLVGEGPTSHTRAEPSLHAVTIRLPVGLNSA